MDNVRIKKNIGLTAQRRSGSMVVVFALAGALSSFVSLSLTARLFGASIKSDAYFLSLSLTTLFAAIVGSVFGTVLLPTLVRLRTEDRIEEFQHLASSALGWTVVITAIAMAVAAIWNVQVFSVFTKYSDSQLITVAPITRYFPVVTLLMVINELLRTYAIVLKKFGLAAFSAICPQVALALVLVSRGQGTTEEVLVQTAAWSRALVLFLLWTSVQIGGIRISPSLRFDKNLSKVLCTASPYVIATAFTNSTLFNYDYVASGLGTGTVTAVGLAQRIFTLPFTIVVMPLMEMARTQIAQYQAGGQKIDLADYYRDILSLAIIASLSIATAMYVYADPVVSLLFYGGKFGPTQIEVASDCLRILSFSLPFATVFVVNGRTIESFQSLLWPSVFGTVGNILMIITTAQLAEKFGYIGIPTARVLIEVIYFLPFGFVMLSHYGIRPNLRELIPFVGISLLIIWIIQLTAVAVVPLDKEGMLAQLVGATVVLLINTAALYTVRTAIHRYLRQ